LELATLGIDGAPSLGKGEVTPIALEWFLANLPLLMEELPHLPPIVKSLCSASQMGSVDISNQASQRKAKGHANAVAIIPSSVDMPVVGNNGSVPMS
jgi:hypothetical protein